MRLSGYQRSLSINNVMAAELMVVFPDYTTDWCYERALLPRKIRTLG